MPLYLTEEDVASPVTFSDATSTLLSLRGLTGLRHILPRLRRTRPKKHGTCSPFPISFPLSKAAQFHTKTRRHYEKKNLLIA